MESLTAGWQEFLSWLPPEAVLAEVEKWGTRLGMVVAAVVTLWNAAKLGKRFARRIGSFVVLAWKSGAAVAQITFAYKSQAREIRQAVGIMKSPSGIAGDHAQLTARIAKRLCWVGFLLLLTINLEGWLRVLGSLFIAFWLLQHIDLYTNRMRVYRLVNDDLTLLRKHIAEARKNVRWLREKSRVQNVVGLPKQVLEFEKNYNELLDAMKGFIPIIVRRNLIRQYEEKAAITAMGGTVESIDQAVEKIFKEGKVQREGKPDVHLKMRPD